MASFTLLQLRTLVRQRADIEASQHITDTELNNYINGSISELYDILIQKFGDEYFLSSTTFNLVNGTDLYDLPADFYKLIGVDLQLTPTTDYVTVKRFDFQERNRYSASVLRGIYGAPQLRYHVQGSKLRFQPTPTDTNGIKLWYVPTPISLSADGDTFSGFNGWEEYVIVDAAIKCMIKEETETAPSERRKAQLIERIESAAGKRDANFAPRITDTQRIEFEDGIILGDLY